jgi:tight adherence protein C
LNTLENLDRRFRRWNEDRKRLPQIAAALPEAIDLLVLVMQAGLDFQVALAHYLDKAPRGALWEEFNKVQVEIRTGVSRVEAFRHLALRTREPSLQEMARAVIQGVELGSSLTPILRAQAQALRKRRAYQAEKRAAVAPLKLMFPLMVFIFPTILVVLFTPLYLTATQGGLR